MKENITESINILKNDIKEKEEQIKLIQNIDWSRPVTEEEWHEICKTTLRNSDLLCKLIKNIFPMAENVVNYINYTYFDLMGFKCGIPTSLCYGVYIDISWYEKDCGEPKQYINKMKSYFEAIDNHNSWYECAKLRIQYAENYRKWYLFLVWFLKYKWKDSHRNEWEKKFQEQDKIFEDNVNKYHIKRTRMHEKVIKMNNELIPKLKEFSDRIYKLNDGWYSIKEVIEMEQL